MIELGFKASSERMRAARPREINPLTTGINYLDRALNGILPDDLLLVGAQTGAGKTEFVSNLAVKNAMAGRRVHLFALEASEGEIEKRLMFKILSREYAADDRKEELFTPRYLDWVIGRYNVAWEKYEHALEREAEKLSNLNTYYRTDRFGINEFTKLVFSLGERTDLVVVDHIHYFDTDQENENRALHEITKGIRDVAQIQSVPVVLVGHLRKKDRRSAQVVPDIEDFHGSSNIGKIATKAVILAPGPAVSPTRFETFVRIDKCRQDSSLNRYVGKAIYRTDINDYEDGFTIGKLAADGTSWKALANEEYPHWLRGEK